MIDRSEQLSGVIERVERASWVALDTEADSLHSYPEKLCLVQLSIEGHDELVDPLAGFSLAPLLEVLARKPVIFHGADYDLRLLYRTYGFTLPDLFDTMWAARLLGLRAFGLTDLTAQFLGVTLCKASRKADWARRPLTPQMIDYARNDTRHLRALERELRGRLESVGRVEWLRQCCERMAIQARQEAAADPDYDWRLGGADKLDRRGLAVLRELWSWRERAAREACRPPFFVLAHAEVVAIAAHAAGGQAWEARVPRRMSPSRRRGLYAAVAAGLELAEERLPEKRRSQRLFLTSSQRSAVGTITRVRDEEAGRLGIDPTLIASRAAIVRLAVDWEAGTRELMPWQMEVLRGARPVGGGAYYRSTSKA